jgi:hypothetical protein
MPSPTNGLGLARGGTGDSRDGYLNKMSRNFTPSEYCVIRPHSAIAISELPFFLRNQEPKLFYSVRLS